METIKEKKSSDLVIERSMELFGFTPKEKSESNIEWMLKNGYYSKKKSRRKSKI